MRMNTLSSILKFIGNRFERMQGGYVTAVEVPSNSYVDREVTFPKAYSAEPKVVACSATTSTYGAVGQMSWSVINVTNPKEILEPSGSGRLCLVRLNRWGNRIYNRLRKWANRDRLHASRLQRWIKCKTAWHQVDSCSIAVREGVAA